MEPEDLAPGGLRPEQVGQRRAAATDSLVRAARPWRDKPRPEEPDGPRLVIFAPRDGLAAYAPDPAAAEEVVAAGTPHLYAGVVEATGFVGPLVRPGATGCAGCLLRARAQREPCWPLLVAQWRNGRRPGVPSCDGALATAVAGMTACAALAHLDGSASHSSSTRTELTLPGLAVTHQTIEPHAECPCGAADAARTARSP
ncbi:hypothetical protein [Streptomyces specialis]|uniref:hypothetical protein n=1 Tax=Streptomyces specialis TaxID=498367 RepID=UPI000B09CC17|nr:hypothetical protein [Streptomyces specialis]